MTKWLFLLVGLSFQLCQCRSKQPELVQVARDTTITKANAFSEFFLDSLQVENFIEAQGLNDTAANRFRNFYNSRNYGFAWFTKDGLAEQASAFWNLHNQYIEYARDSTLINQELHNRIEALQTGNTAVRISAATVAETELYLTKHFFDYVQHAYAGKMDPEALKWHIPRKKINAVALLDSLISKRGTGIEAWEPMNGQYRLMKAELVRFYAISKGGGWDSLQLQKTKTYKEGSNDAFVSAIKKRLFITGDITNNDSTNSFTEELATGVKRVQKRFGLRQTGIADAALVKALNVPVQKRIVQMLINMERMRWMPEESKQERIVANIPEFKIHVFNDSGMAFEMDVVVGKAGNNTVVFNDELKYIVFSPYWNIPQSIVKSEIVPALQKNAAYLEQKGMEQTGVSNGLPVIRQKPGGNNSLGRVKFLFPNSYNIYFHDTPAKSLFARQKRDFSHGCIRLAEPKKLAAYLLRNQPQWTNEKIDSAMNSDKEKWVTLQQSIPVVISYFTAWVDEEGLLNFREDIYQHDKEMRDRLFVVAKK